MSSSVLLMSEETGEQPESNNQSFQPRYAEEHF